VILDAEEYRKMAGYVNASLTRFARHAKSTFLSCARDS